MPNTTVDKITVGTVAVLILAAAVACWPVQHRGGGRFDSVRWKSAVDCRDNMLLHLRSHRLRTDLTLDELLELLGPPDRDLPHTEVSSHNQQDFRFLYYQLGKQTQSFDSCYFIVVLDINGKYLRSFVVND